MPAQTTTFSQQIKNELLGGSCSGSCCRAAELASAVLLAGEYGEKGLTLTFANSDISGYYCRLITKQFDFAPSYAADNDDNKLIVDDKQTADGLKAITAKYFIVIHSSDEKIVLHCESECCINAIVRTFFLLCGSISEPHKSYHLEFALRRFSLAELVRSVLDRLEMRALTLKRKSHYTVYVQEGQNIADILLISGAQKAFMDFELIRVEKEMRNTVNRVVNCDSANTQRIADASARQLQLIKQIRDTAGLGVLPRHLRETAEAKLAYPDLSLKELGEYLNPPIGKSGINHRLKKIEFLARQLEESGSRRQKHEA